MFILVLSILKGSAAASLSFVTPIHQKSLLDYALTHNTVNAASYNETNGSSGLTASADDTYIIDARKEPSRSQDLYTSDEQRRRDQYEIDEENWHEVAFEEVNGTSTCRLALHSDWVINHGYAVDGIVAMNLPEQGISGPFKITAIKHILPQKRPVDEDPDDEWEYKPVTGLFTHRSDQVHTLAFASADGSQLETLGVTAAHPIFSTTHYDWRLAGELEAGEKVLTYNGEATVLSNERKPGNETVYNLEVKDLHNFLVGDLGVVVHNGCWSSFKQKYGNIYETAIDHCWSGHNPLSKVTGKSYFKADLNDQIKLKQYLTDAVGKGNIILQDQVTRTVDGVKRTYITIVQDMGENVGKLKDHNTDTNILTMIFDVTDRNPIINNAFPGLP